MISPRIAGWSTHNGEIVGAASWPAIVDDATWRTVEAILSNPQRRTNPGVTGAVKLLGSGTYVCVCGARRMRASVTGGSKRYTYRCSNRDRSIDHVTRDARALDAFVEAAIVKRLSRPGVVEKLLHRDESADIAALRIEQVELGERKDEAAIMYADGTIDRAQLTAINRRTEARAAEIAETLAKVGWRSPLEPLASGEVAATWAKLSLVQKRAALAVLADVYVLPSTPTTRGFDPAGVRIDWKIS